MIQELSIYINGTWETLDPPTEAVAMNFQVNTLAEFKDRNASYSQAISLPRSERNEKLFGMQLRLDAVSQLPYRSYPCELLVDGSRVSPVGAVLRITSLKSSTIEVQIVGANTDLVEVLKTKTTETAKADGFGMSWMNSSIKPTGTLNNGVKYCWVYANLVKNLLSKTDAGAPEGYINSPDKVYPALNFFDVVKWILAEEGYGLVLPGAGGVEIPGRYEYIPALAPKCAQEGGIRKFGATGRGASSSRAVTWTKTLDPVPGFWGPWQNSQYLSYYATWEGDVTLKVEVTSLHTGYLLVRKNISPIVENRPVSPLTPYEVTVNLSPGEYLFVQLQQPTTPSTSFSCSATVTAPLPRETDGISVGAQYDLLASLGFNTRADIVQEFMRLYGLTMQVNPVTKNVLLYPLGYVLDLKSEALDWSQKLVPSTGELTYQVGNYAQKNTFGLKPDETNGIQDEYTFNVDDSNLDADKDLWTSKMLAVVNLPNGSEKSAVNFPVYEVDRSGEERTAWSLKYSTPGSPVIIRWFDGSTRALELTQGYTKTYYASLLKQVDNVSVVNPVVASASFFAKYYEPLWGDILNKAKALQVTMNLNALDIEGLDLSKPVWLEQYGHYFYVSKIVNYIPGKLTKVNLIRL